MTWAVAGRHAFCARCISDVQVTIKWSNGQSKYFDAVKKVHEIGPGIIVCFANSVRLGFAVIEFLRNEFYPQLDKRLFARPNEVAVQTARSIRHSYKKLRRTGEDVEFLLLIAPAPTDLITSFGVWKLISPNFHLADAREPFGMLEIGSGSAEPDYREIIKRHSVALYEMPNPDGGKPMGVIAVGKVAMQFIFAEALDFRQAGISGAMHITLLSHSGVTIRELPEAPDKDFPQVASTWEEFVKLMGSRGISCAKCAVAKASNTRYLAATIPPIVSGNS